jgi:hypothetical protein
MQSQSGSCARSAHDEMKDRNRSPSTRETLRTDLPIALPAHGGASILFNSTSWMDITIGTHSWVGWFVATGAVCFGYNNARSCCARMPCYAVPVPFGISGIDKGHEGH